ncbi:uncharacterized protein LOC134529812 isoform X2 [Bacillus rossius redtenbacheri]
MAVKPLVCWLDRSPFSGQFNYQERKDDLLHLSLQIATCAQRDRFAEKPVEEIRSSCKTLAELGDEIIQDIFDPLILQPASLDLVTLKKRASDDLGFFILPSFHGVHQIAEINFSSPAHQCGKIENGDEIVQVNYQTVVGWQTKKVMILFEESPTEVFLTLKKRPRHTKVYGQIYMKPYRLPSKKRSAPYSRWNDNLPSPRPELLTIPDFEIPLSKGISKKALPHAHSQFESNVALSTFSEEKKEEGLEDTFARKVVKDDDDEDHEDDDDDSFLPEAADEGQTSPTSMRLYLPKPRVTVQRRATVTGASPTSKRAPVNTEQFWAELRLKHHWRDCGVNESTDRGKGDLYQLRDKSASVENGLSFHVSRPCTTLGISTFASKVKCSHHPTALISEEKLCKASEAEPSQTLEENCDSGHCVEDKHHEKCHFSSEKHLNKNESFAEESAVSVADQNQCCVENSTGTLVSSDFSLAFMPPTFTDQICGRITCSDSRGSNFSAINFPVVDQFSSRTENNSEAVIKETPAEHNRMLTCENKDTTSILQNYCLDHSNENVGVNPDECLGYQSTQISGKERGRLDKSFSTPAYDLLESLTFLEKNADLHKDSVKRELKKVKNEIVTTEVNYCTLQSEVDLSSIPQLPDVLSMQPTVFDNDFRTLDANECNGLTVADQFASCANGVSEPSSSRLFCEEINNRYTSTDGHLQTSNSENHLSSNETSNLSTNSVRGNFDENSLFLQVNTDIFSLGNITKIVCDSQSNLHENTATEKLHLPHVPGTPCIFLSDEFDQTISCDDSFKGVCSHSCKISENQKSLVCVCKPGKTSQASPKSDTLRWPVKTAHSQGTVGTGLGTKGGPPSRSSKGFPAACFSSPRSTRKRNALLSKRRNVSVKDVGCGDCKGWLLHRFRSSGAGATWLKVWFILKDIIFYGFKTPQATKAHIMIILPGFTVCVAEEVKSRSFAFKIYHTGTVFYFAAETADELGVWLECLSGVAISQELVKRPKDMNSHDLYFSETDEDSDGQKDCDFEASIPKNSSKFNGILGNTNQQPGKVCHNSRTESKKTDSPKIFGSLKKIVSKADNNGPAAYSELPEPTSASLDRKYLNFLGGMRNGNVPVPTAQFRSYRRSPKKRLVQESGAGDKNSDQISNDVYLPSKSGKFMPPRVNILDTEDMSTNVKLETLCMENFSLEDTFKSCDTSDANVRGPPIFKKNQGVNTLPTLERREKAMLQSHKFLKERSARDRQIHASNPTLQLSSDMQNYRLAAERLRKFGLGHNHQQEDTSGFITLEELMISRQEEEKFKMHQSKLGSVSSIGSKSNSPHQNSDPSNDSSTANSELTPNGSEVSSASDLHNEMPPVSVNRKGNFSKRHFFRDNPQDVRVTTPHKQPSSKTPAVQKVATRLESTAAMSSNRNCDTLKAAAQYQPPPISQVLASGRKVHPKEEGPKMKLAFEMHLGENKLPTASNKDTSKSSKFRSLFLFAKNQNIMCSPDDAFLSSSGEPCKPLIASPKLNRTFLWDKQVKGSKNSSKKINFNSVTHSSSSNVPSGWTADLPNLQTDCSISEMKPMMGVAMISKKSCRAATAPSSSSQSSSAPDYPGLKYPPVFEPETYTLSNANTLLKSQCHHPCTNNKSCGCNTLDNNQQTG